MAFARVHRFTGGELRRDFSGRLDAETERVRLEKAFVNFNFRDPQSTPPGVNAPFGHSGGRSFVEHPSIDA
jgi:hypothetical protein